MYTEARICLNKSQRNNSSMEIPTVPNSVTQCIKRIHYQVFKWNQCNKQIMESISFEMNGWIWCPDYEIAKPVWFSGDQVPIFTITNIFVVAASERSKYPQNQRKNLNQTDTVKMRLL